MYIFYIIG